MEAKEFIETINNIETISKDDFFKLLENTFQEENGKDSIKEMFDVFKKSLKIEIEGLNNNIESLSKGESIVLDQTLTDEIYDKILEGKIARDEFSKKVKEYEATIKEAGLDDVLNRKQREIVQKTEKELKASLSKFYDLDNEIFDEDAFEETFEKIDFNLEEEEHKFFLKTTIKYSTDPLIGSKRTYFIYYMLCFKDDVDTFTTLKTNFKYDTYGLIRDSKWSFLF